MSKPALFDSDFNPYPEPNSSDKLWNAASSAGKEKRLHPAHRLTFPADRFKNIFKTLSTKEALGPTPVLEADQKCLRV
jgi:hypothetical protein